MGDHFVNVKSGSIMVTLLTLYLFIDIFVWSKAQTCLASQANKAIISLKGFQRQVGNIACSDLFNVFDSMIAPILCYGSEIWGTCYSKIIEAVQIKFCKQCLRVKNSTLHGMVLGECGRLPLQHVYMSRVIKYWCRLIHLPQDRLPHQCYLMLRTLDSLVPG